MEVQEEKYEDEEREAKELKESQHPPNLILDRDETELDNIDVDLMNADCMGIDYDLLSKEDHSTSNSTTIASTPMETSIEEFLKKDEQTEKDSTPNPMVNDSLIHPNW